MSADVENGRTRGGRPVAALLYGALASFPLHLVPHVSVLQAAGDEFADAGVGPRTATPHANPAELAVTLTRKSERIWKGLLTSKCGP